MNHFRFIDRTPVTSILAELDGHPELWNAHRVRKDVPGTPHAAMDDIWVRYNDVGPFERGERPWVEFNDLHLPINYPAWAALPTLRRLVFSLMAHVEGDMLGGILITRIPPGGKILPHVDRGWHVETFEKFYLSLRSASGAIFGCDHRGVKEELNPKPGDIWLFDNRKLHWVENGSSEDRITAIICIRSEKYRSPPP